MTLRLTRTTRPDPTIAFAIQPFGTRTLPDGTEFDFDWLYADILSPTVKECGLTLTRADQIYGQGDVPDTAWHGIQRASLILVDFKLGATQRRGRAPGCSGAREADSGDRPGP